MKKCLVAKAQDISAGCRRELGRSVHMALFMWQPQGVLTSVCDDDIKAHCLKSDSAMDQTPGAIGSCLANIVSGGGARGCCCRVWPRLLLMLLTLESVTLLAAVASE